MNYYTTAQAAEKWGITANRVTILAKGGHIPGAVRIGYRWMIPENAEKPSDGRTKDSRKKKSATTFFRFPLYVNFAEESYVPQLTQEERSLRLAQQDFYACKFKSARKLLLPLCNKGVNRYVRQAALYLRCCLAIYSPEEENFDTLLFEWNATLSETFPYKKEMMLLRYFFSMDCGYYKPVFEDFFLDLSYSYHPSVRYMLALVALIPIEDGKLCLVSELRYDTQELLCQMMEMDGHFFEATNMHFLLLIVYQLKNDKEKMLFHIRRGIQLAIEKDLCFYPACYFAFYPAVMNEVLQEFPADFTEKIRTLSDSIHGSFTQFSMQRKKPSFLGLLSEKEYEYAFFASQGFSNREVSQKLNIPEKTVSKMYSVIYDKLNVKNRQELLDLINRTHKEETIQ